MGIEGVNGRIADIQSRILALQTQQAATTTAAKMAPPGSPQAAGSSFASHLSGAIAAQSTPETGKAYKLNGKGIPEDLAAYGNGKIPPEALQQVGDGKHKLWAPAAEKLTQLLDDAERDGVKIGITDSYRSYPEQVDIARRKGLYSQGGLAAKPGTSEHGWGMATDLDLNPEALSWMRKNGDRYGFVENVKRESWHWAFRPNIL
ncbi:M15 family metallopeptidase [Actinoplanes awajinensis]|uniref:Peptidase M15 n=1 Tax=Actinoplanes awajinensis subsp. mycoplanecinus TaxID=135947 RepID=A0A0X3VC21_9ACTN|nr:M15 family metallopeptidase [Actinoplanes awajinensis]KUL42341.1 peptidase M15 [Actinoplanes awajinensis subsp. mycoplanecinus]